MASAFLIPTDESPTRRRACILVGRELRKIADDLEASARTEQAKQQGIVVGAMKTVCVVAGVVFLGRAVWKFLNTSEVICYTSRLQAKEVSAWP